MTTAQEVITSALKRAGVTADIQTPGNSKSVIGLELLNDWISGLKNDGLDLQLTALALADDIYLDASDIPCLKHNLTVLCAEYWKLPIPQSAYIRANESLDNLRGKYLEADIEEMELPGALVTRGRSDILSGS